MRDATAVHDRHANVIDPLMANEVGASHTELKIHLWQLEWWCGGN